MWCVGLGNGAGLYRCSADDGLVGLLVTFMVAYRVPGAGRVGEALGISVFSLTVHQARRADLLEKRDGFCGGRSYEPFIRLPCTYHLPPTTYHLPPTAYRRLIG
jgi:hypothetical protein